MPTNKILCSRCHSWKKRRKEEQPANTGYYICRSCRWAKIAKLYFDKILVRTASYRQLKNDILKEVKVFERSTGLVSVKQATFIENIKIIMSRNFIRDYKFNIIDNELKSITIFNLPLLGSIDIPIYETKK